MRGRRKSRNQGNTQIRDISVHRRNRSRESITEEALPNSLERKGRGEEEMLFTCKMLSPKDCISAHHLGFLSWLQYLEALTQWGTAGNVQIKRKESKGEIVRRMPCLRSSFVEQ